MSEDKAGGGALRWVARILGGLVALIVLVVIVVFVVSTMALNKTYEIEPTPLAIKPSSDLVDRGKEIATFRGCRDCHGENLEGRLVADAMPVMILVGPNITPGGVTKDYTDEDWARIVRHGIRKDKKPARYMPSYEWTILSHEDMAALISYAKSVPAVSQEAPKFKLGPLGRFLYLIGELPLLPAADMIDHSAKPATPVPGPTATYGKYLSTGCTGCHGEHLSGGKIPGTPPDWPVAPNLTPHKSGLAEWTKEDFFRSLREGVRPDGEKIQAEYMPWRMIAESSDDDLTALWLYYRSIPAREFGNR